MATAKVTPLASVEKTEMGSARMTLQWDLSVMACSRQLSVVSEAGTVEGR
jgi:hypothetical protein